MTTTGSVDRRDRMGLFVFGYLREQEVNVLISIPFAIQHICFLYYKLKEKFSTNGKNVKLNKAKDIANGFNANPVKILPSMDIAQKFAIDHMNKTIRSGNIVYGTVPVGDIDESIDEYKWTFNILNGYFLMDELQIGITTHKINYQIIQIYVLVLHHMEWDLVHSAAM